MSPTVIGFIKACLASLAIGVALGVLIALNVLKPDYPVFLTSAHAHINLLGAVMMLIFGVGYHILPRFSGRPLWNEGLSTVQLWLNIIGLAGMFIFLVANAYGETDFMRYGVAPFGALYAAGSVIFVINIWKTVSGALPAPTPLKPAEKPAE
jgi:cytochrome c oxidase cbb3-type subunit 1